MTDRSSVGGFCCKGSRKRRPVLALGAKAFKCTGLRLCAAQGSCRPTAGLLKDGVAGGCKAKARDSPGTFLLAPSCKLFEV